MSPLILITQSFPFGLAESSFLKEEIKILAQYFDIHIVSKNIIDKQYVEVPHNVKLYRYDPTDNYCTVLLLLQTFCTINYYREILYIIKTKKNFFSCIKKCTSIHMRILHFEKYLEKVRNNIHGKILFYTYWNDYSTFSACKIKKDYDWIISRLHGGDLYELDINENYQPYKCIYNKDVDFFSFISQKGLSYFNDTYYNVSNKAAVNYLGVPEHKVTYTFTDREDIRIISFSYVRDIKRIDKIIDTLSSLNNIRISWVHIGGRYLFESIKEYAKLKLSSKGNISYEFLGEMKNEEALAYISSHEFDFLVNVSSTEGLPMTMMEAFSMSLPVIGTKVGGVPEIITDKVNGFLLEENFKDKDLVDILLNYVSLPFNKKCSFRENAKRTWEEKFNDINNYTNFVHLLNTQFYLNETKRN